MNKKITTQSPKKDIQIEFIKNMLTNATDEQVEYFYCFIERKLEIENKSH
jgi:hypothetical protein